MVDHSQAGVVLVDESLLSVADVMDNALMGHPAVAEATVVGMAPPGGRTEFRAGVRQSAKRPAWRSQSPVKPSLLEHAANSRYICPAISKQSNGMIHK